MTGRSIFGRFGAVLALQLALVGPGLTEGSGRPAELPPSSYAGLQYVDSKGCVFMRAGTEAEVLWVPRVTAGGHPVCGYPPSGHRAPAVGDAGVTETVLLPKADAADVPKASEPVPPKVTAKAATPDPAPAEPVDEAGDFLVALGSFGFPSNVLKATAAAEALGFSVETGQMPGGEQGLVTVFAGPFDRMSKAEAALKKLHAAGYPEAVLMRR